MKQIDEKDDIDIILTGTQPGIIPILPENIKYYPLRHQIFLQAVRPDAVLLCIMIDDEMDIIVRTIKVIEGLTGGIVIGVVCFPMQFKEPITYKRDFNKMNLS